MERKVGTTSTLYRIISDQLGSPVLVVKVTDGTVLMSASYDEWGKATYTAGEGEIPFGFAGGIYDKDTKLIRFGARDYDPEVGRWVSKDPILFGGRQGNLYAYVNGDPINFKDPSGHIGAGLVCSGSVEAGVLSGFAANVQGGAGMFVSDRGADMGNVTGGAFWSRGAFVGKPDDAVSYPDGQLHEAVGAYAGVGAGVFFTNANSVADLFGPFDNFNINTPFFSANIGFAGGIFIASFTIGLGPGLSSSTYATDTGTWPPSG